MISSIPRVAPLVVVDGGGGGEGPVPAVCACTEVAAKKVATLTVDIAVSRLESLTSFLPLLFSFQYGGLRVPFGSHETL